MPVQYTGILDEHRAVRTRAGLFDLSHMGEIWVSGEAAGDLLAAAVVTDPRRLAVGRAQYSILCATDGGIVDDLIIYRVPDARFLVVPNAGNARVVAAALREAASGRDLGDVDVDDASDRTSLIAIQGPAALAVLAPLTGVELGTLRSYAIARGTVAGVDSWIARTGYTGEDGFEVFVDGDTGLTVWRRLLEAGAGQGLIPVGLGARDTLRLEAGMPLYGNELDRGTTPFEAGQGRIVRFEGKGDFFGRASLEMAVAAGPRKLLVGLALRGPGIARHGYPVHAPIDGAATGVVTSGTQSPTLGRAIAMAYLPPEHAAPGTMVEVGIRATRVPAEVVPLPFYRRA